MLSLPLTLAAVHQTCPYLDDLSKIDTPKKFRNYLTQAQTPFKVKHLTSNTSIEHFQAIVEPFFGKMHRRYILASTHGVPSEIQDELENEFQLLPKHMESVSMRKVTSVGAYGTGEKDMAHHYHPITIMRLVVGQKIWALAKPHTEECARNEDPCADPFDPCEYYQRPGVGPPPCVQYPGDIIFVPDGWYHGTCNNASLTIGVAYHGRYFPTRPKRATKTKGWLVTTESSIPDETIKNYAKDIMREKINTFGSQSADFLHLQRSHEVLMEMVFRQISMQFKNVKEETHKNDQAPNCLDVAMPFSKKKLKDSVPGVYRYFLHNRSREVGFLLLPLSGGDVSLEFEGEWYRKTVGVGRIAAWRGDKLRGLSIPGGSVVTFCVLGNV